MKKVTIKVEFGYCVSDKERCNIEKGEVLNMLRLSVFIGDKDEEKKVGSFLIKELVKEQKENSTLIKTQVITDKFNLKLNRLLDGCVFPFLRNYNMKDISLEITEAENFDSKLSFLYSALRAAGVKDYKAPFNRNGFYTLEEVEKQVWAFDKETFRKSLNIASIVVK